MEADCRFEARSVICREFKASLRPSPTPKGKSKLDILSLSRERFGEMRFSVRCVNFFPSQSSFTGAVFQSFCFFAWFMHVSRASETASPELVSPLQEAEARVTVGWAGALPRARDPPPPHCFPGSVLL